MFGVNDFELALELSAVRIWKELERQQICKVIAVISETSARTIAPN